MTSNYGLDLDTFIDKVAKYYAGSKNSLVDPSDLKQAVAEKFLVKLDSLEDGAKLHGWLRAVIRNQFYNMQRDLVLRATREQECAKQRGVSIDAASDILLLDLILGAIEELEDEYKEVIRLRLLDDFSTRETAYKLNIPEGTVSSRLRRGRLLLASKLKHALNGVQH